MPESQVGTDTDLIRVIFLGQLYTSVQTNLSQIPEHHLYGRVAAVQGILMELGGIQRSLMVGDHCHVQRRSDDPLRCEVAGFREGPALLLPYGPVEGIRLGCKAEVESQEPFIRPTKHWLGRVFDALGRPVDDKGSPQ